MMRFCTTAVTLLVLSPCTLAFSLPPRAPVLTLAARSLDNLSADSRNLALLLGEKDTLKQMDAFFKTLTSEKGWAGLDGQRPLGVYFPWPDNPKVLLSLDVPAVAFLPITDQKAFLGLLNKLGCSPQMSLGGLIRLSVPEVGEVLVRFANGYAYAAQKPGLLRAPLPDPKEFLRGEARLPTLAARLYADRIPDNYKPLLSGVIERIGRAIDELVGGDRQPDESEVQFQQRQFYTNQIKQVVPQALEFLSSQVIGQVREVALDLNLDARQENFTLDLAVLPRKPDNELANLCRYAGRAQSRFAYLLPSADWGLTLHLPKPERADRLQNPEMFYDVIRQQVPARYREVVLQGDQILLNTLMADGLDGCVMQLGAGPGRPAAIVAGLKVREGQKLDYLLRDTLRMLPVEQRSSYSIRLNHHRHGKARIHQIRETSDKDDDYLAIRDELVLFGLGKESLGALRLALDGFGKAPPPPSPLLRFEASGHALLKDAPPEFLAHIQKAGARTDPSRLRARTSVSGGADLRIHFEVTPQLLQLLSLWATAEEKK
jgi:hypothetical protein